MANMTLEQMEENSLNDADFSFKFLVDGKWLECVAFENPQDLTTEFKYFYNDNPITVTRAAKLLGEEE